MEHSGQIDNLESHNQWDEIDQPDILSGSENTEKRNSRDEGFVRLCDGETAVISAAFDLENNKENGAWAIGQLISVAVGKNRVVGLIFKIEADIIDSKNTSQSNLSIHIELVGEISQSEAGQMEFNSGISSYPNIGAKAHKIRAHDLAAVYENTQDSSVKIGTITQDESIDARISLDSMLSRHFAVVGTTGVGKSTAVTLLLNKIVASRPDVRTLLLDPHNEFAAAFPDTSIRIDATTLSLPYWMFTLTEFVEVINRGRSDIAEETDILRDLIPLAKSMFSEASTKSQRLSKKSSSMHGITADTPIPYRIEDLIDLIEDRLGKLESKTSRPFLSALKHRLNSVMIDPRFAFMFTSNCNSDAMNMILSQMFRIPSNGRPICIFELSGLPSEVVNVVVSVVCRLAFELGVHSAGTIQTLVVCEEAHRYIPVDPNAGFWPTRVAISRIAKEGRKYGVYLGVISQRPGELDPTILSQCNTVFSMRLGNDSDQEIVKKAINGATRSTSSFLSSLANRECIAFGEAIGSPMRMMFEKINSDKLPGSNIYEKQKMIRDGSISVSLDSVINKMASSARDSDIQIHDNLSNMAGFEETNPTDQMQSTDYPPTSNQANDTPEKIGINFFPLEKNGAARRETRDNEANILPRLQPDIYANNQSTPGHPRSFLDNPSENIGEPTAEIRREKEMAAGLVRSFRNK